jgi:hypothetical protein
MVAAERTTTGIPTVRLDLNGKSSASVPSKVAAGVDAAAAVPVCVWVNIGSVGTGRERFAQVHATSIAYGRVLEETTASHTLGVGASASGGSGSWSGSGTMTKSSGYGYDTGYHVANKYVSDEWRYVKYGFNCGGGYLSYEIRPSVDLGGPFYADAGTAIWCAYSVNYNTGSAFHRTSGANKTFSTGMSISGVSLSAQSGWTTSQETHFSFTSNGKMCASTADGLGSAPLVRSSAR